MPALGISIFGRAGLKNSQRIPSVLFVSGDGCSSVGRKLRFVQFRGMERCQMETFMSRAISEHLLPARLGPPACTAVASLLRIILRNRYKQTTGTVFWPNRLKN
jgi:hypothetical protein